MLAFTIRNIPKNLHHAWKVISSVKDVSMRVYILKALRKQVEADLKNNKNLLKERNFDNYDV